MTLVPILEEKMPNMLEITGEDVPGKSGAFEVYLTEPFMEQPLHSKLNGQGPLVSQKIDDLVDRLSEIFDDLKE